jgi:hypothetical protein
MVAAAWFARELGRPSRRPSAAGAESSGGGSIVHPWRSRARPRAESSDDTCPPKRVISTIGPLPGNGASGGAQLVSTRARAEPQS